MEDVDAPNAGATATATATAQDALLTLASLGLIAEHIHQAVFAKDRSHRFVLINQAFCDLVNLPRETLLGQSEATLYGRQSESEQEVAVLQNHTPISGEREFDAHNGSKVIRPTTHLPLTDAQGAV